MPNSNGFSRANSVRIVYFVILVLSNRVELAEDDRRGGKHREHSTSQTKEVRHPTLRLVCTGSRRTRAKPARLASSCSGQGFVQRSPLSHCQSRCRLSARRTECGSFAVQSLVRQKVARSNFHILFRPAATPLELQLAICFLFSTATCMILWLTSGPLAAAFFLALRWFLNRCRFSSGFSPRKTCAHVSHVQGGPRQR